MAGKRDKVKDCDRYSIVTNHLDSCYICGGQADSIHEIFHGVRNRAISKEDGLTIGLCHGCHTKVHENKWYEKRLFETGEKYWLNKYTDKEKPMEERVQEFINRYGKNFIDY